MDVRKIHIPLAVVFAFMLSMAPVVMSIDSRYAHAEDIQRTNAQIILDIKQSNLDMRKEVNQIRIDRYTDIIDSGKDLRPDQEVEFKSLQKERHIYIQQTVDLENLRKEIK